MAYGKTISTDFRNKQDTVPTFYVRWNKELTSKEIVEKKKSMQEWLKVRLNNSKVKVINY